MSESIDRKISKSNVSSSCMAVCEYSTKCLILKGVIENDPKSVSEKESHDNNNNNNNN